MCVARVICISSLRAQRSNPGRLARRLDCFVASLLAMTSRKEKTDATKTECAGVAFSAAHDLEAMARAAVPRAARVSGAGAVYASAILARLRARALPSRAPLSFPLSVFLGSQTGDDRRRAGRCGGSLPLAACA